MQAPPFVLSPSETAFFFDFDGTLVELAPTPDGVLVQPEAIALLAELRGLTNGAVAVVSGRGIDSIDAFLGMPDLPIAGLHGAERRDANGDTQRVGFNDDRLLRMEQVLAGVVNTNPGMLLEIKGAALALHYRNAPDREPVARAATARLVAEYPGSYVLQPGKMVYEIKPKDVDKGRALRVSRRTAVRGPHARVCRRRFDRREGLRRRQRTRRRVDQGRRRRYDRAPRASLR